VGGGGVRGSVGLRTRNRPPLPADLPGQSPIRVSTTPRPAGALARRDGHALEFGHGGRDGNRARKQEGAFHRGGLDSCTRLGLVATGMQRYLQRTPYGDGPQRATAGMTYSIVVGGS